jgi:methylated-DNA-[protein]-cysteine S-methyltransferase
MELACGDDLMNYTTTESPLGTILLAAAGGALTGLYFVGQRYEPKVGPDWRRDDDAAPFAAARQWLDMYFSGEEPTRHPPLSPHGTPFQKRVWREIARIPRGETITYAELARRAGNPAALRAAGAATGRNPISLIVPCHRVVGSDGSLTGYAGGLERKRRLLGLEAGSGNAPRPDATVRADSLAGA